MGNRYTIDADDIYDVSRPLRDTDITDRLNEQDETIDILRAERDELRIRLAEYRQVNALATSALERYAARFGPLS